MLNRIIRYLQPLDGRFFTVGVYVTASCIRSCRYNLSLNTRPVPLSAGHERPCQQLIRHYRHHLRPDNLSQAIPHLRVGGTLKDNQIVAQSEVPETQWLSGGCVQDICLEKKQGAEAGGSNSYSLALAFLQLNCQLSSQSCRQTTAEREEKELRVDLQPWSLPMSFCPRGNLGDIKEKRDEKPPNDTQWIKLVLTKLLKETQPTAWCSATRRLQPPVKLF